MKLPFTAEQFFKLFRDYNQSIFPLQIFFYIIAALPVLFCISRKSYANKVINSMLAFFWLWMGVVYHLGFFASINKAAYFFGTAFVIQGILFTYYGVIKNQLKYKPAVNGRGILGLFLIVFSLVIYPLLGIKFDHVYPASPTFGLPCPTTIFTFGILLWSHGKIPKSILVIPFLWALIGFTASIKLGITEDISLLISAVFAVIIVLSQRNHQRIQNV